ncbi:MAG TPA: amino acid adenylation domain-containing protein [Rudaea sp.]|nr:amino acid adenylation domain-containing protein [Rudaea sp.]
MERAAMLELTPTQREIYLDGKLSGEVVNNLGGVQRYACEIDVARFRRARDLVLQGNDAYRLRFVEVEGRCTAMLGAGMYPELDVRDYSAFEGASALAEAWMHEQMETAFARLDGALFADALIKIAPREYWYFAKAHHLVMDGWGFALQMQRFLEHYARLSETAEDTSQAAAYPSFAAQMQLQAERASSAQDHGESLAYWLSRHAGASSTLFPPRDRIAAAAACSRRVSTTIGATLLAALRRVADAAHANLVAVFHAALYVYFTRAHHLDGLVVCSPVHNRRTAQEKEAIGSFVNVNAHRIPAYGAVRFAELVRNIALLQKQDYRHSRLPLGALVRALREREPVAAERLNELAFNYQKLDFALSVDGTPVATHYLSHQRERTPLTFVLCEYAADQEPVLHLDYNTAYVDGPEADAILVRIHELLQQIAEADLPIDRYRLPSASEWSRQLAVWNDTGAALRENACIHDFFEEQARRAPDAVALRCGTQVLSYRELDARANRLAHRLIELGAGPERLVGVCHGRSPDLVVALLAVLKAGAAYVPIDPGYPAARIAHILDDARVELVLADAQGRRALAGREPTMLDPGAALTAYSATPPPRARSDLASHNLAYAIYTSGSTGLPKGVLIEHRNAAALIEWALTVYSAEDLRAVLASTSVCFDLSVFEIFVTLAAGGCVVLVENALSLVHAPEDVSLINTVPSAIKALLDAKALPARVRCINLAGERLRQELVDALYEATRARVYDLYGPSEDTTYSTFCLRTKHGRESIGRPIANTQVYVLDAAGEPLPIGCAGELYIGGAGLARGYLDRPALTAERFVFNRHANARLYRTGDWVRFFEDGSLQYLGRRDTQVKIRGHRVELGEIEARLLRHPDVAECAVLAREDVVPDGSKVLVAYVVPRRPGALPQADALANFVAETLPAHMVPSLVVQMAALPLTPNGKVDRNALPAPDAASPHEPGDREPAGDVERAVAAHWQRLLGVSRVGARDRFFALGGDSLLLVKLAAALEAEFRIGRLDPSALFAAPTLEAQAALVERKLGLARMLAAVGARDEAACTSHIDL